MNFYMSVTSYKDATCEIHCTSLIMVWYIYGYIQDHSLVTKLAYPRWKTFAFGTDSSENLKAVLGDLENDMPMLITKRKNMFHKLWQRFWLSWAIVFGCWDFIQEIDALMRGDFKDAAFCGACGALVVLFSLSNYWSSKKEQNSK